MLRVRKIFIRGKVTITIVLLIMLMVMAVSLSGCAVLNEGWQRVKGLLSGEPQQTDVSDPSGSDGESSDDPSASEDPDSSDGNSTDDPMVTTEPPEGEEFVKAARRLDSLLWEVGEKLYYIDSNSGTLRYRYDVVLADSENNSSNTDADGNKADGGSDSAPVDEMLTDGVSAIVGFSQDRIFCLSAEMFDESGRVVRDVVALAYDGSGREIVALQVDNAAVLDDNWLLVSRFGDSSGLADGSDSPVSGNDASLLELVVLDLKKSEETVVFVDDGNLYPGMDQIDAAMGAGFVPEDDGLRIEIAYPGYSEYPYVRYLLFEDGAIVQDSKIAPWQDNLGQYLYEDGMAVLLQEVKIYDDLVIYEQRAGDTTSLIFDHPDKTYDLLRDSRYFVMDFFYHQGHVLAQVYDPDAGIDQPQLKQLIFDPESEELVSKANNYDRFFQYQDSLAGLRIERLSEETTNNVEGRFIVELVKGDGEAVSVLFDQVLKTGSVYGDVSYSAWRAGHDLVIRYETHEPEIGTVSKTTSQWIFIRLS